LEITGVDTGMGIIGVVPSVGGAEIRKKEGN
jgi:hypothetical protein